MRMIQPVVPMASPSFLMRLMMERGCACPVYRTNMTTRMMIRTSAPMPIPMAASFRDR